MRKKPSSPEQDPDHGPGHDGGLPHLSLGTRLRNYFLAGLVITAPIGITIYLTWSFVSLIDKWVKPLVPARYNPDNYLPFSVPGVGLIFAIFVITLLGFLAANYFGRSIVAYGEMLVHRTPLISTVYRALKQIFETAVAQGQSSFNEVGLIEYPRKGLHAMVFIATPTKGEVASVLGGEGATYSVFLPTTPNPTSGFLLFVPKDDVIKLSMSVEDAAKLVISAGLVAPEFQPVVDQLAQGKTTVKLPGHKAEKLESTDG